MNPFLMSESEAELIAKANWAKDRPIGLSATISALLADRAARREALCKVYADALELWVKHVGVDVSAASRAADLIDAIRSHAIEGLDEEPD